MTTIQAVSIVEHMLESGMPFTEIEDFIQTAEASTLVKDALWLLAWAEATPDVRREVLASLIPEYAANPGRTLHVVPDPADSGPLARLVRQSA